MFNVKFNSDDIENIVAEWNLNFPIDQWWRRKHSIPFNSLKHREVSFLEMIFEYKEDYLINSFLQEKNSNSEEESDDSYGPLKPQLGGTDEDYDNIDLANF